MHSIGAWILKTSGYSKINLQIGINAEFSILRKAEIC